ncbi:MAG: RNA polymerase subunit sigma-24 [Candidatus Marinimicrobia bacterium]|nr:RNA polymerase subunit sigma-24 [Candidatus Neomarinimicrobiota bacterium]|tara:strand:- start:2905 stop:3504 length:600 start_codon:yes stop_codon:yes gene_type:complete
MSLNKQSKFIYSDEELIKLFQEGDEAAYVELVNRYKDRLYNFVYYFLGDSELSEDIVQETMIKLYQKKHYYKEIAKFSTWLYTIARNLANTELRKIKRRKITYLSHMTKKETQYDIPAIQESVEQGMNNEFVMNQIEKAINNLPEHFRLIIILRDIQKLSYDDISEIVSLPLGTVKSRINRARLQLRVELKEIKEYIRS